MAVDNEWQADSSPDGGGTFDLKRMLWGRKWLLLICAFVGVGGGYYQFTKQPEVYSSSGQVLLKLSQPALPVEGISEVRLKDPIDEHLELIRKGKILEGAVTRLQEREDKVATIEALGSPARMADVISSRLRATRPNPKTNFITISYTSPIQAECQPVLEAVFESYEEYLSADQRESSDNMVTRVEEAKAVLDGDLKRKRNEYRQFRQETSLLLNGEQTQNLHQDRVIGIEHERALLQLREKEIQAELSAIESAQRRGTSRDVLMIVADQMSARSSGAGASGVASTTQSTITSQLLPLKVKEALLLKKLGEGHPDVQAVRTEISVVEDLLRKGITGSDGGPSINEEPKDFLTIYTEALQEELRIVIEKGVKLTALYVEERAASRLLEEEVHRNREYLDDIQRTQDLYDQILKKLEQINLVKTNDNYSIESISTPTAGYKTGPDQNRFLSMGGFGGLMIGVFLSFLIEISDRGFRSANEISRFLGTNVIGHIPQIDAERGSRVVRDRAVDKNLAVFQRPRSNVAEAYRGVRTSLLFGIEDKTHTVIQVTSPDPGDGKSTLSSNLAAALAGSGKKVLLMDVDLRKPRQHKIFNYDLDDGGVTSVMDGTHTIEEAAHKTVVDNLWMLTAGPRVEHPGELLLSPKFGELLTEAKAKYDFVIVDTPPVLPVTDSATIAPSVDGVILVFRLTKHSKPHAMQAIQELEMVGARMIGVVVNGVGSNSGYSYGSSEYGYRYGSGYGRYEYRDRDEPKKPRSVEPREQRAG
ncbi:MAG: polysaccharide biosynthesis tyrosine autokinase [Planctomycetaceae bacterium]